MYKWACIVNPVAGGGYAVKNLDEIRKKIQEIDPQAPIRMTERPGHASEIASEFVENGYNTILVAGGDGTVHEVGSVLVGREDLALGIISAGTGNDYNYMAGFPDHFEESHWAAMKMRNTRAFDVGICNGQYFFNGMGLGFDATMTAASHADREKTGKTSKGRYTMIILKTLIGYREDKRLMAVDGSAEDKTSFLTTIAVGRRFAGSYHLTPRAIPDDGLLDICDVGRLSLLQRLNILTKVPKGTHLSHPSVEYMNCSCCRFDFDHDVPAHLDGELIFSKSFEISLKERCLNIITNS